MLDKCLEVRGGGLFLFVLFLSGYDLHVLPGVKQPLWDVGEIHFFLSFFFLVCVCFVLFFVFIFGGVEIGEGIEVLQFWDSW